LTFQLVVKKAAKQLNLADFSFAEKAYGNDDDVDGEDLMDDEPGENLIYLDDSEAPPPDEWRTTVYREDSVFLEQLAQDQQSKPAIEGIDQIKKRIIARNTKLGIPREDRKLLWTIKTQFFNILWNNTSQFSRGIDRRSGTSETGSSTIRERNSSMSCKSFQGVGMQPEAFEIFHLASAGTCQG